MQLSIQVLNIYGESIDILIHVTKTSRDNKFLCLCKRCNYFYWKKKDVVLEHLICNGFEDNC